MTQTGGLAVLFGWLIFGALLALLAWFVLRHPPDEMAEARRRTDEALVPPPGDPAPPTVPSDPGPE
jgi:hypothetical protein